MSKEERYAEHTVAWELPNGDSVTKSNYNLADIETKYMPIQTEVICDDKDKTIADLEAKLAESEKKAYSRGHSQRDIDNEIKLNALKEDVSNKEKRIVELKQQLAEKEKERHEEWKTGKEWKWAWQKEHQDKISFAVEQLEKVKEFNIQQVFSSKPLDNFIDNQIKQLKEGK